MRFTDFYAAASVCSASRAALLTGRYPARTGVTGVLDSTDPGGLALSETTVAQTLKESGYRTGCVGKWHLGTQPGYRPTDRGFDEYFGIPYSNDMSPRLLLRNNDVVESTANLQTLSARYTQEATQFIQRNAQRPFFLYFPHTFPHVPLGASPRFAGKSPAGRYGDVIEEMDWGVGELLRVLEENGLTGNTLILITSDNGPWSRGSAGTLRGRKGETWDGGMRVPCLASMPGRIPAGQVHAGLASTLDFLPTIAEATGVQSAAQRLDGVSLWPALRGETSELAREPFLFFEGHNLQCARMGRWKAHFSRYNVRAWNPLPPGGKVNLPLPAPELYDLALDPEESYECAEDHPEVVAQIRARVNALLPTFPNEVQWSWRETLERKVGPVDPGALPVMVQP